MAPLPSKPAALLPPEYENICKCRHATVRDKRAYLTEMARCPDRSGAEAKHELLRAGKLRRGGAPRKLYAEEGLGVVVVKGVFVDMTAAAFGMSPRKLGNKMKVWLSYERKRAIGQTPTEKERSEAWAFRAANVPARQDGEIWLFRNPKHTPDAFAGILDQWLGARLGLRLIPGEARLTFGFRALSISHLAQPTFFDAAWVYLSFWHWSGKTLPLPGTPSTHKGLEELVGDPPALRELVRPVVELVSLTP